MEIRDRIQEIMMENEQLLEIPEEYLPVMKEVFLRGFMCSTPEFNGQHAGVEYKESQMRAGSQLWERYFKESFNKCIRRLKRFGIRG